MFLLLKAQKYHNWLNTTLKKRNQTKKVKSGKHGTYLYNPDLQKSYHLLSGLVSVLPCINQV
jgi:hypothetical protein